jgi:hypothetical protein
MSKKSLIILVVFLLILFGGAIAYLFLSIKPSTIVDTNNIEDNTDNPFPFGTGTSGRGGNGTGTSGTGSGSTTTPTTQTRPALRHLSLVPVAGAGIYETGSSTQVRYIERGTGYIYQARLEDTESVKLSNTPIIKIYEAFWTDKNSSVIIQKLKEDAQTIDSFLITMSSSSILQTASTSLSSTLSSKITPSFLGPNMFSVTLSPKRDRVAYLTPINDGGVVGIISKIDGSKKVQAFDSSLTGWILSWPNESTLTITTKALSNSPGFLYFVSTLTNATTKILGGINGLTTLTNDGATKVLFSKSVAGGVTLATFDVKYNTKQDISLATIPEKCVWGKKDKEIIYCGVPLTMPSGKYPDAWYQGRVSFSDELWKINTNTGELKIVADLKNLSGQDIDMTHIMLSGREDLLVFINKADLTLWSFELR